MKPLFKMGDRVRLTERGLRLETRCAGPSWTGRTGVAGLFISPGASEAYVLWDGRKSIDVVPFAILEKAAPSKGAAPTTLTGPRHSPES